MDSSENRVHGHSKKVAVPTKNAGHLMTIEVVSCSE